MCFVIGSGSEISDTRSSQLFTRPMPPLVRTATPIPQRANDKRSPIEKDLPSTPRPNSTKQMSDTSRKTANNACETLTLQRSILNSTVLVVINLF